MKNILKKFVSSLLAFTVVFSLCGVANVFASENNIDDNFFDELYKNYNINRVKATRMLNSNASLRGAINELLITNYK